jgi:hypothetical protein
MDHFTMVSFPSGCLSIKLHCCLVLSLYSLSLTVVGQVPPRAQKFSFTEGVLWQPERSIFRGFHNHCFLHCYVSSFRHYRDYALRDHSSDSSAGLLVRKRHKIGPSLFRALVW